MELPEETAMELTDEQKQIVFDNPLTNIRSTFHRLAADMSTTPVPDLAVAQRLLLALASVPEAASYLEPTREQNPAYRAGLSTLLDLLLEVAKLLKPEYLKLLLDLVDKLAAPVSSVAVGEVSDEEIWLAVIAFVREFYIQFYSVEPRVLEIPELDTLVKQISKCPDKNATLDARRDSSKRAPTVRLLSYQFQG